MAIALGCTGSALAAAELSDLPPTPDDAADIVADGIAIEAFLEEHGLGAAWRSATEVHPRARTVTVLLEPESESMAVGLLTTADAVGRTEEERVETSRLIVAAATAVHDAEQLERDAVLARNIARHHLEVVNDMLALVAVDLFELAYDADDDLLSFDLPTEHRASRDREITQHTVEEVINRKRASEERLARTEEALAEASALVAQRQAELEDLVDEQGRLTAERAVLDDTARRLLPDVAERWVTSEIMGQPELTPRALHAYLQAELTSTNVNPGCRISWTTIAAIGAVEGAHGRHGNREITRDGTSDRPIIGLALDGKTEDNFGDQVAEMGDTDGGRYDQDTVLDHAVGPMQFIPETWEKWRIDGDEDGEEDPHDIDDAALATAGYLCSYGSHRSWTTWNTAVYGYNHSNPYVASVKASHDRLLRLRPPIVDSDTVWQPDRPSGYYAPPPEPEPSPETG